MRVASRSAAVALSLAASALAVPAVTRSSINHKVRPRDSNTFTIHIQNKVGPGLHVNWRDNPSVPGSTNNVQNGLLGAASMGVSSHFVLEAQNSASEFD